MVAYHDRENTPMPQIVSTRDESLTVIQQRFGIKGRPSDATMRSTTPGVGHETGVRFTTTRSHEKRILSCARWPCLSSGDDPHLLEQQ